MTHGGAQHKTRCESKQCVCVCLCVCLCVCVCGWVGVKNKVVGLHSNHNKSRHSYVSLEGVKLLKRHEQRHSERFVLAVWERGVSERIGQVG